MQKNISYRVSVSHCPCCRIIVVTLYCRQMVFKRFFAREKCICTAFILNSNSTRFYTNFTQNCPALVSSITLRIISFILQTNPADAYPDINKVWAKFNKYFMSIGGLVAYRAAFEAYHWQTLTEFMDDGVTYLEFRGVVPEVSWAGTCNDNFNRTKHSTDFIVLPSESNTISSRKHQCT